MFEKPGGRCVVDLAFCRARFPFLIKSGSDVAAAAKSADEILMKKRQDQLGRPLNGACALYKALFPRLHDRLCYEERGERRLITISMLCLFNFRTALVELNQLLHTYMPLMSKEAKEMF